ncbi:hypothetical protein [Microbulbifer discodermiae]|uniref:hypothetical protein n=1 Tax=Microbulbifer sp. 2201CG32-9 TaxID=3232309 RepID=UPI00345C355C
MDREQQHLGQNMEIQSLPADIARLNLLGCADELDKLFLQINAIATTLTYAADESDENTVEGACWCIKDLVQHCTQVKRRAWQLMPRTE